MLSLRQLTLREFDRIFGLYGLARRSDKFYGHRYDGAFPGGRKSISISWHIRKPALVLDSPYASVTLDEVEKIVAKYEEKNALATPADVAWRGTAGCRLDRGEALKTLTGRWAIVQGGDCQRIAADYAEEALRGAEAFWSMVSTPDAILAKLSDDPSKVRAFALPDYVGAEKAIVLSKLLHGNAASQALARDRLDRLSGTSRAELEKWLSRASLEFAQ